MGKNKLNLTLLFITENLIHMLNVNVFLASLQKENECLKTEKDRLEAKSKKKRKFSNQIIYEDA